MHTLTLSFPTLSELSAAVAALTRTHTEPVVTATDKATGKAPAAAPKPRAAASSAASAPATEQKPAADAKPADAEVKKPAIDYPTLQKAVFKLAGIPELGRDAAKALSASFGVATFKELDASKWDEALAATNAKIVEVEALRKFAEESVA